MLNSNIARSKEALVAAVVETEHHLRRHGQSLINLLETLDDPIGFNAFCDLHGTFGDRVPDADVVETSLREIRKVLADQRPSVLEQIGHERKLPVSEMTLWHGARITDLLGHFSNK